MGRYDIRQEIWRFLNTVVGTGPLESILKDYKVIRWISSQVTKQDNVRGKEKGDIKTEPANRDTKLKTKTVYVWRGNQMEQPPMNS